MLIPVEGQVQALRLFLNLTFVQTQGHSSEDAPIIVSELCKNHKVKLTSVEEVLVAFGQNLDGVLAMNEEAWHIYAHILVHLHPQPATSGWGWSRVGWNWMAWWKWLEKVIASLEASKAADVLCLALRLAQDREGRPLSEVANWSGKLKLCISKLAELSACSESEAISRFSTEGVSIEAPAAGE
jgi:hypothetical protein